MMLLRQSVFTARIIDERSGEIEHVLGALGIGLTIPLVDSINTALH